MKTYILISSIILHSALLNCQTWIKKADMHIGRNGHQLVAVDGKMYSIGGDATGTVEEFDPEKNTWTTKSSMNKVRSQFGAAAINGKIYVVGGEQQNDGLEEYDPQTDKWTIKKSMPTRRGNLCAATVNGKLYVIGGLTDTLNGFVNRNIVEEYDPLTDSWIKKKDMPTSRHTEGVGVVNGIIYVIGGSVSQPNGYDYPSKIVEAYDPSSDTWITKTSTNYLRAYFAVAVLNEKIYAICGADVYNNIEEYDPLTNKWKVKKNVPVAIWQNRACEMNGKIYIGGGIIGEDFNSPLKTFYEYIPESSTGIGGNSGSGDISVYPNPFSSSTSISFSVQEPTKTLLEIFSSTGDLVETLYDKNSFAGKHQLFWQPYNLKNGVYFLNLTSGNSRKRSKILYLR